MITNYHTHTRWCRHGEGEIEDFIEEAVRHHLEEIAMTEHVPHADNLDPKRMRFEEFPAYNKALDSAVSAYCGKIRVIKGMECEYYPEEMDWYRTLREQYGYEIMILGQHKCGDRRQYDSFRKKGPEELKLYGETVCLGLETGFFTFLAHPDVALNGYEPGWDKTAETVMRDIFQICQDREIPVEINANGFRQHRAYPNEHALLLSKEYRLTYLISADAHEPRYLIAPVLKLEQYVRSLGIEIMPRLPDSILPR